VSKKIINPYSPHPKQLIFHQTEANEVLYGGSAGPGKSMALRQEALDLCMAIPNLQVYLFRRTYPELEREQIVKARMEFPKGLGVYKKNDKRWEFINGSMLNYGYAQYEDDVLHFQGAEIHVLMFDELTEWTEFMYDFLRARVRCALPIPTNLRHKIPGIYSASNPGNVGHEWVKRRFVDFAKPFETKRASKKEGGMLRQFIPALMEDNPTLMTLDPGYRDRVDGLPEPLRSAWLNGDWNIHLGQAFGFNRNHHVCNPRPIPEHVPIYFTYDYGFRVPFSCLWFWEDNDRRLFLFNEWYGWNGTPNQGLRLTDSEVADGIIAKEKEMGIWDRLIMRVGGPDCFNKKPDYKGGGQGPSTAEVFGNHGLKLFPGDPNRKLKIRQFHERLKVKLNEEGELLETPMIQVYNNCIQFIRTIPLLQFSHTDPEYIETGGVVEEHCFDSACHVFMARPIDYKRDIEAESQKQWESKVSGLDPESRRMAEKTKKLLDRYAVDEWGNYVNQDNDQYGDIFL
jgi:hypothetical protein